ncbi:MAG: ABC transporter ATP-binding protein [Rubellimicrobium sp.]|nr:ABC transporter ATP-binding protein [Rubellimicrobium sp.]
MATDQHATRQKGDLLLYIRDLRIDGFSNDRWHRIVRGVDLTVRRGEIVGLIGESGAGKSSLGLAAMGYVKPGLKFAGGQVLFEGTDLVTAPERLRRHLRGTRIAYVAQSATAAFNPARRLLPQTVEAASRVREISAAEATREAVELYRQLQLPNPDDIGFRYPHQVSGGQLQRVMTAMAMICRPDLIIFDEPTTALDVTTQAEVLASIRGLVESHQTAALYITHDLAVVAQMADRITVLRHGEKVEESATREMLAAPREDYTRSLWAVRNLYQEPREGRESLLTVKNLDAFYGAHKVLDNVSLEIPKGRTLCVVGESGSGKSTLARAVMGLVPPRSGTIAFDGRPLEGRLRQRGRDVLRRIQMVHQMPDSALNPRQTVGETIGRSLSVFRGLSPRDRHRETLALLDRIELGAAHVDRLPGELSGGQKQRVCIARALAADPDLIICDEVTSALDQVVQEGILKLLLGLQAETGVSYMFITHDINTVRAIADGVIVMRQGEVVAQGMKDKVLNPPFHPYTELLLSSVPEMDPDWLTGLLARRRAAAEQAGA